MNTTDIFADNFSSQDELIQRLKEDTGVLESKSVEDAFHTIDRQDFVREDYRVEAYEDYPLPIGEEQTISQPTTVVYMLEMLDLAEGQSVLDVGCGSGWTTGLIAHIIGAEGRVIGVELRDDLVEFGKRNLAKYDLPQAEVRAGNALERPQPEAPFDRILVSAGAKMDMPEILLEQLAVGGIIVAPINNALIKMTKESESEYEEEALPGFRFVPLEAADDKGAELY